MIELMFSPSISPATQFLNFKLYGFLKIHPPSNIVNYNSYFSQRNVWFFSVVYSDCKCSKNVLLKLFLKPHGMLDNKYCCCVSGNNICDRWIGMRIPLEILINFTLDKCSLWRLLILMSKWEFFFFFGFYRLPSFNYLVDYLENKDRRKFPFFLKKNKSRDSLNKSPVK
jgi:hypothetical protein